MILRVVLVNSLQSRVLLQCDFSSHCHHLTNELLLDVLEFADVCMVHPNADEAFYGLSKGGEHKP